jgi:hypothetical protein
MTRHPTQRCCAFSDTLNYFLKFGILQLPQSFFNFLNSVRVSSKLDPVGGKDFSSIIPTSGFCIATEFVSNAGPIPYAVMASTGIETLLDECEIDLVAP